MYKDQFTPWSPMRMQFDDVTEELCWASALYPDTFVCIGTDEWLSIRVQVNNIIMEVLCDGDLC